MENSEIKLSVPELQEGDQLAADLYVEGRLLMKRGSYITSRIIAVLKSRNVHSVVIKRAVHPHSIKQNPIEKLDFTQLKITEENVSQQFFTVLAELSVEKRYGHVLKNAEEIEYVKNLFLSIMSNEKYRFLLNQLKSWDLYSYLHSIDVFVLSTLFAKQEGISNIEHKATGFIFHDIGKLRVPHSLLDKRGKLTKDEFEIMKQHTFEGYKILNNLGLSDIAYLAKSHHENQNGTGYPDCLTAQQMTKELQILHLIDVYSAITMKRSYREAIGAANALSIIFRDEENYCPEILSRFVDFIGIYPENSIVRLSDKSYALIKQVNEQYPLLPIVKKLNNNQVINLPINYQLTIEKMIQYQKETIPQLLNSFYEYLINEDTEQMEKTYLKLTDSISEDEHFIKLFIPTFQILNVLLNEKKMSDIRYKKVIKEVNKLLNLKLIQLQEEHQPKKSILFLTEQKFQHHYFVKLLQGLFFTRDYFPFLVDATMSENEITNIIDCCNAHSVYVIRDHFEPVLTKKENVGVYHLTPKQLEQIIFNLSADAPVDIESSLEKYKKNIQSVMSEFPQTSR